jgi:hypothetical protein
MTGKSYFSWGIVEFDFDKNLIPLELSLVKSHLIPMLT